MRLPPLLNSQRKKLLIKLLLNGFMQAISAVAVAVLASFVFDSILQDSGDIQNQNIVATSGIILLTMLIALLRRKERVDADRLGQEYIKSIRRRLFNRVMNSQQRIRSEHRRGSILIRFIGDLNVIRQWVSLGLVRIVVASISVIVVVTALAFVHPWFSLLIGGVLLLTALAMWGQGKRLQPVIRDARRRHAYLSANITEKVARATVVQLFDQVDRERRYVMRQNQRLIEASAQRAGGIGSLRAIVEVGSGMAWALSLFLSMLLIESGTSTPGTVIGIMAIIGFLTPPLRDLGRAHEYWLSSRIAMDKLTQLGARMRPLKQPREITQYSINYGDIQLLNLTVNGALKGISAQIRNHQRIALVGNNGSGKSTLLSIIARLQEPDRGRVYIDDVHTHQLNLNTYRQSIAFVGAEAPLICGTIRKNLGYGIKRVSHDELNRVLQQCELTGWLSELPKGLDSRVTEGGENLSQGQRARICLARALLMKPKVLLLDEADAHLDARSLRIIDRIIEKFDGTLVMATHRRRAIQKMDQIWHLHNGQIIAKGRPNNMLNEPGPTRDLFYQNLKLVS